MKHFFDLTDIEDILLGAHLFASGGGGALENGKQLLKEIVDLYPKGETKVQFISPESLGPSQYVAVMAAMGAPQSFLKLGFGKSPVKAFTRHEKAIAEEKSDTSFQFSGVVPVESGVIAHAMCLLVAAKLNIPIVDGDGGGRAFPSLQMATFANPIDGHPVKLSPAVLCSEESLDEGGSIIEFQQNSPSTVDLLTRAIISCGVGFHNRASLSCFAMNGTTVQKTDRLVWNTLTRARSLGSAIRESRENGLDAVQVVLNETNGMKLFEGKLKNVITKTNDGFDFLTVTLNDGKNDVVIVAKNESMLAWQSDRTEPIAMAPDSISYMTPEGEVLCNAELTEAFNNGQRPTICLLGIPANKSIVNRYFIDQFQQVFENIGYYGTYESFNELSDK